MTIEERLAMMSGTDYDPHLDLGDGRARRPVGGLLHVPDFPGGKRADGTGMKGIRTL